MKTRRKITQKECPWLKSDIPAGTEVFGYDGCTYGCISPGGIAITIEEGKEPFLEIPLDSLNTQD